MRLRRVLSVPVAALALVAGVLMSVPGPAQAAGSFGGSIGVAERSRPPSQAQWQADVRAAMRGGNGYLDDQAGAADGVPLAINLDIDNTSLATYYHAGTAVGPTLRFTRHAHDLGMKVFFNTGRTSVGHVGRQLAHVGFPVDGLCTRNPGEHVRHSKQRCRDQEVATGVRIVANVGNSDTDFVGRHQGRRFVLPNYGGALS